MKTVTQSTFAISRARNRLGFSQTGSLKYSSASRSYSNNDQTVLAACVEAVMISLAIALTRAPFLPRPFVCALSSPLAKDGGIMQRNNGASLCQLAPIRRTYRLCQNRRRPNCSSMALTRVGGVLYKRPEYVAPRHSTGSCVTRPGGVGRKVFVVHRLMATWILL